MRCSVLPQVTTLSSEIGRLKKQRTETMAKEVKSVERWRDELDKDAAGGRGRFMILSRELFNSRAFADLGWSGTITVLSILNRLEYEKKGKDRKGVKIGNALLRHNGEFVLTINELVARGLSRSTATGGREIAWELGFFDVIEPGTIHHTGRYRFSQRWKKYPNGEYKPTGQLPPGKNVYPQSGFRRKGNAGLDLSSEADENICPCSPQVKRLPCFVIQLAPKHRGLVTY